MTAPGSPHGHVDTGAGRGGGALPGRVDAYEIERGLTFDPFQREAMDTLVAGRSVVVSAPTGSGKTLVAEFGIALALETGRRGIYTTPLKALSNQKFHDLGRLHGPENVGLLTGDNSIRGDAPVVVMTTEVLRNMLYTDPAEVGNVGVVVLDEVHYLQDPYRGGVWEEVIIHLPRSVQLVCLSATVSNSGQFGEWVETLRGPTEVVSEDHRPVPLEHWVGVKIGSNIRLLPLLETGSEDLNPKVSRLERQRGRQGPRTPRRYETIEALRRRDLLPAIYFIFSRVGCERAVEQLLSAGLELTRPAERRLIRSIAERRVRGLARRELTALGFDRLLRGILAGIAPHHAGMVPAFRELVEELFLEGLVKVAFATETLSLGINMPARTVVVEKLTKFGGERHEPLTPSQYTQLAGRAGRRGIDSAGHAVVLWTPFVTADQILALAVNRSYTLESSFTPNYNMVANLVSRLDLDSARRVVASSFAQYRTDSAVVRLERQAETLRGALTEYRQRAVDTRGSAEKRWKIRAQETERRLGRLERRVEARAGRLGRRFDAICELLVDLGYLEPGDREGRRLVPTGKGELLRRLYSETDLVTSEALYAGLLEELEPDEMAAALSVLTFVARREGPVEPLPPSRRVRTVIRELIEMSDDLAAIETERELEPTRELDDGFAGASFGWANGMPLEDLVDEALGGGDFVRNVKQLIDACRQVADATSETRLHEGVGRHARQAARLLNRGVVALSTAQLDEEHGVEESAGEHAPDTPVATEQGVEP